MKIEPNNAAEFNRRTASSVAAEELFLPSIEAIVRHIARVVAEHDYNQFLANGEISHCGETPKEGGQDD